MTRREQALFKINTLVAENARYQQYITNIESEYAILTDQYMNGNIEGPIGKEQKKLMRLRDSHIKHIQKNNDVIRKLQVKYNL